MKWAQVTLLVLLAMGMLYSANRHGKTEEKTHNFFVELVVGAILFFLYWKAGTYSQIF